MHGMRIQDLSIEAADQELIADHGCHAEAEPREATAQLEHALRALRERPDAAEIPPCEDTGEEQQPHAHGLARLLLTTTSPGDTVWISQSFLHIPDFYVILGPLSCPGV